MIYGKLHQYLIIQNIKIIFKFMGLNTPIAFIVYNRPVYTDKTFEIIRSQKPKKLFLIADGPNPFKNNDNEACQKVRKIVENINWDCEVHSN